MARNVQMPVIKRQLQCCRNTVYWLGSRSLPFVAIVVISSPIGTTMSASVVMADVSRRVTFITDAVVGDGSVMFTSKVLSKFNFLSQFYIFLKMEKLDFLELETVLLRSS